MDAFFASVEQRDNPELRGWPVIVGGNPRSRGVVAACSYEARRHKIRSAMPCSRAAQLCPGAIFLRPRMSHYREVSKQIMEIFLRFTSLVEPLSLDEAFLDVTASTGPSITATRLAYRICETIQNELGLSASAGVSFNKFLAKIASDVNKPKGITTITPEQAEPFIDQLPIRKFFGVGEKTELKMRALGIAKGSDLRAWEEAELIEKFGKIGGFLFRIVRGIDHRPVVSERIRKSIGSETTFSADSLDTEQLNMVLGKLAGRVVETLQHKNLGCSSITLKVRYSDFTTISRSNTVLTQLRSEHEIFDHLKRLLTMTEAGSRPIRLLGCSLSKLEPYRSQPHQLYLPFARL